MKSSYIDAIVSLVPNAQVSCVEETGETIWYVPSTSPVSINQIEQERERLGLLIPLNACKEKSKQLIAKTDWAVLPDVGLKNSADFVTYRGILRGLIITPVADPVWPTEPTPVWE